jgi:ribose transport system substrate-binding protein
MAAGATITVLVAACSSASNSAPQTSGAAASPGASGSSSQAKLLSQLAVISKVPNYTESPGSALDAKSLSGRTVALIDCAPAIAPVAEEAQGVMEAAKKVGITIIGYAGGNEDESEDVQFFDEAIARKPAAIISDSCEASLLTTSLQKAQAAGIPVVIGDDVGPEPNEPGQGGGPLAFGTSGQPNTEEGAADAEYISAHNSNAQIGFISTQEIAASPQVESGFKSALKADCPGCSIVDVVDVNPTVWATDLGPTVTGMLSSHPGLSYIVPVFDGMTPYIQAALTSSSQTHHVGVVTTQGSPGAAISAVQSGLFTADVGTSSIWTGWQALDQAMRGILKMAPESNPILPVRVITQSSLGSANPSIDVDLYGTSYETALEKVWGLG